MKISERIKLIRGRDYLNLNQQEFAKRIGISRSNLANIETDKVNLTERVAKDICEEFNISYIWLMEEIGDIFINPPEEIFDEIKVDYKLDNDDIYIIKEYASLNKEKRKRLTEYIKLMIEAEKKKED